MALLDWFQYLLYLLGLYRRNATIVVLGLDNAGKTTLLHKMRDGKVKSFIPTQRATAHEIQLGALSIKAWDLGGHEIVRELWADYFAEADAIIYMVDSADHTRLPESAAELEALMKVPDLAKTPIAVLANKKDLATAVSREELIRAFALEDALRDEKRPLEVFRTSTIEGSGYREALQWLSRFV